MELERDATGTLTRSMPERPAPAEGAGLPLAELLRSVVERQAAALRKHEPAARDGSEDEAVHDMRVASRRLRTALRVFRDALPARRWAKVRRGLRRLGRSLGPVRDLEVQRASLAALLAEADESQDRAALEAVTAAFNADLARLRRRLRRRLNRVDVDRLARAASALARRVRGTVVAKITPFEMLKPLAARAFAGLDELRVQEQPNALHGMRVRVKRLRYAIELFQSVLGRRAADVLRQLRALQEALGRHHDMLVLEERLLAALRGLTRSGQTTLADGLLNPIEILRSERYRAYEAFVQQTAGVSGESILRSLLAG